MRVNRLAREADTGAVVALNDAGAGIVRGGKTAFVAGALPGETIRFRRVKRHRQYDDAQLVQVLEPAASRVEPRCAHFGICGGCALQHMAPAAQLASKAVELRAALQRIGNVSPSVWLEPLHGPSWQYRRRARLGAKYVPKKGRVLVGFRERSAPYVAALERCHILAPPVGELIEPLSALLTRLSIRQRVPQIEIAVGEEGTALVLRALQPPSADDETLLREFAHRHGVRWYLQESGLQSLRALATEGAGEQELVYRLPEFDLSLAFAPTDFVQVNAPMNRLLVARAVELLGPDHEARVLDLFCGLGNFTLALSRVAGSTVGVEGDAALIARARANARRNGIENAVFEQRDLASPLSLDSGSLGRGFTHVLLDPPRTGALAALPAIAQLSPKRVLYVSCHPGTLARDLGALVHEHGFHLLAAGVVDMFPHTTHVESLALLEPGS